jgi:hypothetical protein
MKPGGNSVTRRLAIFVAVIAVGAFGAMSVATAHNSGDGTVHSNGSAGTGTNSSVNASATNKVLILDATVDGGASSPEAQSAVALGFGVDIVNDTTWAGMTTPQFAAYRAIIIGDPDCGDDSNWAAADANPSVWAPTINGNIISIGTDPDFHMGSHPGALTLIQKAMAFATAQAGKTGFYADLSCWEPSPNTPIPLLNVIEPGFTAGPAGCGDNVAIVATNPFLSGLTNTDLEGWSCSVHEFFDAWPADFVPIALDTDAAPSYTAPDGTQGSPYIIGRGAGLVAGDISLTPETGTLDFGNPYTLTAFVQFQGTVQVGTTVTLTCTAGPDAGLTATAITDATGNATFTVTAPGPGVDTCHASFVNPSSVTENSNDVTINWTGTVPAPVVIAPKFTG